MEHGLSKKSGMTCICEASNKNWQKKSKYCPIRKSRSWRKKASKKDARLDGVL